MTDFSVYLTSIGHDRYQAFIKNSAFDGDFIRIIQGYTEMTSGKRTGGVTGSWIISPLKPDTDPVFIQEIHKRAAYGKRLWIAFEAVKRHKPKNKTTGCFIALAPTMSSWRKTVGSATHFDIKAIDSIKRLEESFSEDPPSVFQSEIENSPSLARISGTISLS